jgi:hypothetical protein
MPQSMPFSHRKAFQLFRALRALIYKEEVINRNSHRYLKETTAPDAPMPQQRFQVTNFRMSNPPNGRRVMRPGRWGNPFRVGVEATDAAEAVALFREYLQQHPELVALARRELAGFDLGCTCPLDQPCHADVWLEVLGLPAADTGARPVERRP